MATTKVDVNLISATGTASSSTFLRGDSSWNAPAAAGMTFISSTDISSAATFNFTAVDASSYDAYCMHVMNLIPATDDVHFWMRTSTDGGSSYDDGNDEYFWGGVLGDGDDGSEHVAAAYGGRIHLSGATENTANRIGSSAGEDGCSGVIWIHGPHLTKATGITWLMSCETADGTHIGNAGGAFRRSAADVDAFQLLFSSGNIESGTVTVYGLANA